MKADEQLKCKDCDWYGSCEYYDRRKETSQICKMFNNTWKFVAELEKIKAEIEAEIEKEFYLPDIVAEQNIRAGYLGALAIVDKRISELKGENNE